MELITLRLSKECRTNRKEVAEAYIRKNILGKENRAVLVAGFDARTGRDKVFQVLALRDIKEPLQWDCGKLYRHPIEEGKEKMFLEYMTKFPCVFVCQ